MNRFSELGTWRLNYLDINDKAGNLKEYDKIDFDNLGFPSSFEVTTNGTAPEPTPSPSPTPTPKPPVTGDPPNLVKATLRGASIILQFDNLLANTLPSTNKFTLTHGNREYLIIDSKVKASHGLVNLTAEKLFDPTVSIVLDYLDFSGDQTTGVIESPTGVDLQSFSGFALNNQGSQINSLTIDDGEFDGNQITLFLSAPKIRSHPFQKKVQDKVFQQETKNR